MVLVFMHHCIIHLFLRQLQKSFHYLQEAAPGGLAGRQAGGGACRASRQGVHGGDGAD